eukprot:SAG25_NODE_1233_length_3541_cov_9.658629_2_plen_466_part_00
MNGWVGPLFPNSTETHYEAWFEFGCGGSGCLFRIDIDESEHHDVAADPVNAARLQNMTARAAQLAHGVFSPFRGTPQLQDACAAAQNSWSGFWGPWIKTDDSDASIISAKDEVAAPQVVVFRSVSYGCSHRNNCIQQSYQQYNWTALTTVITFTQTNLSDVVALARAHNVRVIQGVMFSETHSSSRFNTSELGNRSYIQHWIGTAVDQVKANHCDGFSLDVEHFRTPLPANSKALFTSFVCLLQKQLQAERLTLFAVDTQIWGKTQYFDLPALAKCSEYLLPMAYDMVGKDGVASANSPLPTVRADLAKFYTQNGVPPHKVILGLPTYGYAFPCSTTHAMVTANSSNAVVPCRFGGNPIPSATWQIGLGTVIEKLNQGMAIATGRDTATTSAWMEFEEKKHKPLGRRQVWYDDAQSLEAKADTLAWSQGLGGVALWSIDALRNMPKSNRDSVYAAVSPPSTKIDG